jgi:hypothetical protein
MLKRLFLLTAIIGLLAACGAPKPASVPQAPPTQAAVAPAAADTPVPPTAPAGTHAADVAVAAKMAGVLYDLSAVQKYYNDGASALAQVTLDTSAVAGQVGTIGKIAARRGMTVSPVANVPPEFLQPLPSSGAIAAPAGACPAAANPAVTFSTAGGNAVTPQLISDKKLQTIPSGMITVPATDPNSLFAKIDSLVKMNDMRLASAQGWNDLLWGELKKLQKPAESLMDYQLWNASPDIEQQVADLYQARLTKLGAPPFVVAAFNASNKTGWYANAAPTPDDALAKMDIQAVMTGSVQGTVHEQRQFSLPGAGKVPTFGPQTGEGTVTWETPDLGVLTFEVNILLDKFDEQGRAIGGTVSGVDAQKGYEVHFTFLPDGTKKGELLRNGVAVGELTMTTNAEKFENYVDMQTDQTEPLPTP